MKALFFFLLLAFALCDRKYFTYKKGTLQYGNEASGEIFGHLEIMNEGRDQYVELNGLHLGGIRRPFAFIMGLPKMNWDEPGLTGECRSGKWDLKSLKLTGTYSVTYSGDTVKFEGACTDLSTKKVFKINFTGNSTKCLVFQPPEPAIRSMYLIGEKISRYRPAYVLNFAYYDYPFMRILRNCRFYLNKFGDTATEAKPGYAIVGKDGMHCGVVDHEGTKFIHANPAKKQVTLTPLALANNFFRNGFVFKTVPCKGPHDY